MLRAAAGAGARCGDCAGAGLAVQQQKELLRFRGTHRVRAKPQEGSCRSTAASPSPFVALLTQLISQALRQAACRGGDTLCGGRGRRMLPAGSSSPLPAAAPQGRAVQAPVAVTQAPGTCCGAERGGAGAPAPPRDILQPGPSGRLPLPCPGLQPRVWAGCTWPGWLQHLRRRVLPRRGQLWSLTGGGRKCQQQGNADMFSLLAQQLLPGLTHRGVCF